MEAQHRWDRNGPGSIGFVRCLKSVQHWVLWDKTARSGVWAYDARIGPNVLVLLVRQPGRRHGDDEKATLANPVLAGTA